MTKTIKRKKFLFWYQKFLFRVCDCFLDSILSFKNELNSVGEFCDNLKELLFDDIPIIPDIIDDVFFIFGKISIVFYETALYQFDCKKFISHDKMYGECLAFDNDCNCLYLLEKKFPVSMHFVQIVSII